MLQARRSRPLPLLAPYMVNSRQTSGSCKVNPANGHVSPASPKDMIGAILGEKRYAQVVRGHRIRSNAGTNGTPHRNAAQAHASNGGYADQYAGGKVDQRTGCQGPRSGPPLAAPFTEARGQVLGRAPPSAGFDPHPSADLLPTKVRQGPGNEYPARQWPAHRFQCWISSDLS